MVGDYLETCKRNGVFVLDTDHKYLRCLIYKRWV